MKNLSPVQPDGAFVFNIFFNRSTPSYALWCNDYLRTLHALAVGTADHSFAYISSAVTIPSHALWSDDYLRTGHELVVGTADHSFAYVSSAVTIPSHALWSDDYLRTGHELAVGPADRRYDRLHMRALVGV